MNNHWLNSAKQKKLFKEIVLIGFDVEDDEGTLRDLFASLNLEQMDLLLSMPIREFTPNLDEMGIVLDLLTPELPTP